MEEVSNPMKGLVLSGGKGTRLRPLTHTMPKQLVPVANEPILGYVFHHIQDAGIKDVLIVTHYLEDQIKRRFGDGSALGLDLSYLRQEEMKGTADAFRITKGFVNGEEFIGFYGDLYVNPEIFKYLIDSHSEGETTLCVVPVENPSQTGVVELDGDRVVNIVEKPRPGEEPSKLGNAGVYVFSPDIFKFIAETGLSQRNEYEITDSLKALIESGGNVNAVPIFEEDWLDVGLPWNLLEANRRALGQQETEVEGEIEEGVYIHGSVRVAEGARIRSGAYIEGPVYVGPRSDIGPNCYLRPSTYLGADVRIGNACEIKNSIIMDSTHIAHLSYVGDSIIGENCNFGAGTITANIRFDKKNINVSIKDGRIDSGQRKFGSIIGDDVQTGINVNLMPGIKVGSGAWISPGLTIIRDVAAGTFVRSKKT